MREYLFNAQRYYIGAAENPGSTPSHNGTFTAPVLVTGAIPRWNGSMWEQVENHTKEKVWIDGVETEIKEYGPLPEGASLTPPLPTLEEAKAAKLAEITAAKWAEIETGVVAYEGLRYATDTDSQGLIGNAMTMYQLSGVLPPFWKAKDGILQSPTIGQLTAIAAAMYAYMEEQFMKELTLSGQVQAATTLAGVAAVTW